MEIETRRTYVMHMKTEKSIQTKSQLQNYDFRSVTKKDAALLKSWLSQPHIRQWWGEAEQELKDILDNIDSISVEPMIVELNGKPVAYVQTYDPHLEDDHPYQDQRMGTIGIDISIGDEALINKGHGAAILCSLAELLFEEGVPRLIIDPDPANVMAIKAYEKAGFAAFDTRISQYGPALMMALDNLNPLPDEFEEES
jgi:aminoglycoside 6'-N-acetyltransferase